MIKTSKRLPWSKHLQNTGPKILKKGAKYDSLVPAFFVGTPASSTPTCSSHAGALFARANGRGMHVTRKRRSHPFTDLGPLVELMCILEFSNLIMRARGGALLLAVMFATSQLETEAEVGCLHGIKTPSARTHTYTHTPYTLSNKIELLKTMSIAVCVLCSCRCTAMHCFTYRECGGR